MARARGSGGHRRVRRDAAHPDGRPAAEQTERMATALATLRGEGRATPGDRIAAVRWLLETGFGPPPDGGGG